MLKSKDNYAFIFSQCCWANVLKLCLITKTINVSNVKNYLKNVIFFLKQKPNQWNPTKYFLSPQLGLQRHDCNHIFQLLIKYTNTVYGILINLNPIFRMPLSPHVANSGQVRLNLVWWSNGLFYQHFRTCFLPITIMRLTEQKSCSCKFCMKKLLRKCCFKRRGWEPDANVFDKFHAFSKFFKVDVINTRIT